MRWLRPCLPALLLVLVFSFSSVVQVSGSSRSGAWKHTLEERAMEALAPLPPALSSREQRSFAEYTFSQRLPAVLENVKQHTGSAGEDLLHSLLHGSMADVDWGMPCSTHSSDKEGNAQREGKEKQSKTLQKRFKHMLEDWRDFCDGQEERRAWGDVEPAISMETLFYRKVLEAAGYFQSDTLPDPFLEQKVAARAAAGERLEALAAFADVCSKSGGGDSEGALDLKTCTVALLHASVWGNRADLSLQPSAGLVDGIPDEEEGSQHHSLVLELDEQRKFLLVDDAEQWFEYLMDGNGLRSLDFVTDNVGLELGADMALLAHVLDNGLVNLVTVHLKFHPTFVSDVTVADWEGCLEWMRGGGAGESGRGLAAKLSGYMEEQRLKLTESIYWTGPRLFWQLPERWAEERFGLSGTTIFKGDANYRKLVGDRKWQETERSFEEVVSYFPSPVLALRTAKAETVAGIPPEVRQVAAAHDAHWMTNGRWGAVQFAPNAQ